MSAAPPYDIIVAGGGPAGIMAALSAAQAGAAVCLWERNERLGKKLAITGKGRCNITNQAPVEELVQQIPGNGAFLYGALHRLDSEAVMQFFEDLGVRLKTERGRRVFPLSDSAHEVVDALQRHLAASGVAIHYQRRAQRLLCKEGRVHGLADSKGQRVPTQAVVLATGGQSYPATGSTGDGYRLAQAAGHSIITPRPALAPLETVEAWPAELSGLSLKNVRLQAIWQGKPLAAEFGELLFTHFGLSGPIVLTLSRAITALPEQGRGCALALDLKPALMPEQLDQRLLRELQAASRKQLGNALSGLLPAALLPIWLRQARVEADKPAHQLSRAERARLVTALKALPLTVRGPRPLAEAIVTAGGVDVREVNPKTMASKKTAGLYLCGELLDIDGYTGGYNLQAAWSSGHVAGLSAAAYARASRD